MNRRELHILGRKLMDENGLADWKLELMSSKRAAGQCVYAEHKIRLSVPLAEARSEEETRNTIIHEIAHALTPGHKHDRIWAFKCRALGGDGKSHWSNNEAVLAVSRWTGECPNGHKVGRSARSDKMFRISCAKCSPIFNAAFRYTWTDTSTGQVYPPMTTINLATAAQTSTRRPQARPAQRSTVGFTDIEALFR